MAVGPYVRAGWTQTFLTELAQLSVTQRRRIETRLGTDRLTPICRAIALHWVPLEDHIAVLEAIREELGDARFADFFASALRSTLRKPSLFAKAAGAGSHLVRGEPLAALAALPLSASQLFRDAGRVHVEKTSSSDVRVVVCDLLPESIAQSKAWWLGWEAAITVIAEHTSNGKARMVIEREQLPSEVRLRCWAQPIDRPADGDTGTR